MRYLPLTDADRMEMRKKIGITDGNDLYADVPVVALDVGIDLPDGQGEIAVERRLAGMAARSRPAGSGPFFCGAGAYRHHLPASVDHLIQRSEFMTSYTPYQPEISQGTLQVLFEFQSQVALLTGMDVANASMYDGSTAAAEAVLMALRVTGRRRILLSARLHPQYAATIDTLAGRHGEIVSVSGEAIETMLDDQTAAVVVQNPDVFGGVRNLTPLAMHVHAHGALLIVVVTEIVSLGLIESPGAMGADIVAAEGQSLAGGLNFGGPYIGLFAAREDFVRQMPGRLVGQTLDTDGRRGFVLALSTREQHIRREKATSNICTNSGLTALAFSMHLTLLGEEGLTRLAAHNHAAACRLADTVAQVPGATCVTPAFFNEFTLRLPVPAADVVERLAARGLQAGVPASRLFIRSPEIDPLLIVAATELTTDADGDALAAALTDVLRESQP